MSFNFELVAGEYLMQPKSFNKELSTNSDRIWIYGYMELMRMHVKPNILPTQAKTAAEYGCKLVLLSVVSS